MIKVKKKERGKKESSIHWITLLNDHNGHCGARSKPAALSGSPMWKATEV